MHAVRQDAHGFMELGICETASRHASTHKCTCRPSSEVMLRVTCASLHNGGKGGSCRPHGRRHSVKVVLQLHSQRHTGRLTVRRVADQDSSWGFDGAALGAGS